MNIVQFFRILWAYRLMILVMMGVCIIAGVATVQLVRPRYEAQSRVMLDIIKPDPVTGQVMATAFLRAYTKTQIELVKDPDTARVVVQNLNLAKNPVLRRRYEESNQKDTDFETWAAQEIARGANARLIEASNILEISYSTDSPSRAKQIADGLRQAYVDTTLRSRQEAARRNAEWYEDQAEKTKAVLFQAEALKAKYERENGLVLGADKIDIDSARLAALASQGAGQFIAPTSSPTGPATLQLAELDSSIAEASRNLGPNHPALIEMRRRREIVAGQAARERNSASQASASAMSAAQATSSMLEAQKAKVMAQREKVERLRLMQDEIDLRRDQYSKAVSRGAQLRQEAQVAESGVVPLAAATTPQSPVFPNKPLIIGGAGAAGLILGLLIAMMREIFNRRVRSAEDLMDAVDAPMLAIIRSVQETPQPWWARLMPKRVGMGQLRPRVA